MGVLESRDVHKRYGATAVLRGVSFTARPGAITLLAGPNGAGKTTWIRVATGLARPQAGEVLLDGQPVPGQRHRLGVVLDHPSVYPHLNGYDNIRCLAGVGSWDRRRIHEVAGRLGLGLEEARLRRRAGSYSHGQKRLLVLACALVRDPQLLLLDEPSLGVDAVVWRRITETLKYLRDEGRTILLTGQNLNTLEALVDDVAVLRDGRIVFHGSLAELRGLRPPRVEVRVRDPERLGTVLRGAQPVPGAPAGTFAVACGSRAEAEAVACQIQGLGIPLLRLEVREDTLEEAFTSLLQADGREQKEDAHAG